MKRILALTRYDHCSASTRQRFAQYVPALAEAGFEVRIAPLLDGGNLQAIDSGRPGSALGLAGSYWRRLQTLLCGKAVDLIWVQYEVFPYLPAMFERAAFRAGVPVVVDYDDAFFHRYDLHRWRPVRAILGGKMQPLIEGAATIVAGNAYLADYARHWNMQVTIVPTVVDTATYQPRPAPNRPPVTIGWIGSPTTWRAYVRPWLGQLRQICEDTGARFLVVGAGDVAADDRFPGMALRAWSEDREIGDIQDMDIGIMPLPDDPWARGKCGYKLIQYMACGLPTVASPVGVNAEIVVPGETGFLAEQAAVWRGALARLIDDPILRRRMGLAGQARVEARYSLRAQAPVLVEVMQRALGRGR